MKATFDRDLEKLAFFLNQVWAHYTLAYPTEVVMMNTEWPERP